MQHKAILATLICPHKQQCSVAFCMNDWNIRKRHWPQLGTTCSLQLQLGYKIVLCTHIHRPDCSIHKHTEHLKGTCMCQVCQNYRQLENLSMYKIHGIHKLLCCSCHLSVATAIRWNHETKWYRGWHRQLLSITLVYSSVTCNIDSKELRKAIRTFHCMVDLREGGWVSCAKYMLMYLIYWYS